MFLSSSGSRENNEELADAWLDKAEQCYRKGAVLFTNKDDKETIYNIYRDIIRKRKRRKTVNKPNVLLVYGLILLIVGLVCLFTSIYLMGRIDKVYVPKTRKTDAQMLLDNSSIYYPWFLTLLLTSLIIFIPPGVPLTIVGIIQEYKNRKTQKN